MPAGHSGWPTAEPSRRRSHDCGFGRFVARVDLAYPDQRVAVEYDGRWHADTGQFGRDRRRLNALVAAGWRVIHVTAADLRDLDTVLREVREALGA